MSESSGWEREEWGERQPARASASKELSSFGGGKARAAEESMSRPSSSVVLENLVSLTD